MDDELGTAVGQDQLERGRLALTGERPQARDERGDRGGRRMLLVAHRRGYRFDASANEMSRIG